MDSRRANELDLLTRSRRVTGILFVVSLIVFVEHLGNPIYKLEEEMSSANAEKVASDLIVTEDGDIYFLHSWHSILVSK